MSRFYGQMTIIGLFIVNLILAYQLGDKGSSWLYFILFCAIEFILSILIYLAWIKKNPNKDNVSKEELANKVIYDDQNAWTKLVDEYKKTEEKK